MTTSGVYGFNPTVGEIVLEAFEILQVASQGETLSGDMVRRGINSLNYLLRKMQTDGIHLWTYTEGTLFLTVGQAEYDFGDSDTHVVNTFFETTVTAEATASATSIVVDDFSNIVDTDAIGIITSDNGIFWTTVNGTVTSSTITLTDALPLDVNNGAIVYNYRVADRVDTASVTTLDGVAKFTYVSDVELVVGQIVTLTDFDDGITENIYSGEEAIVTLGDGFFTTSLNYISDVSGNFTTTTEVLIPVSRLTPNGVRRRESTDYEIPIIFESRVSYTDLPNKNQLGQPIQAYYQRSIPFGKMSLWTTPDSAVPVINFTYERQLQQVTTPEETLDVSEEYIEAIVMNLAKRLIPKSGATQTMIQLIRDDAERSYDEALAYDDAVYPIEIDMGFHGQSNY